MNSPLPEIDYAFLEDFLVRLLNTPSPTGFTEQAIALVQEALAALPSLSLRRTRKGALLVTLPGPEAEPVRALTAHVDTLGAMVKSIKPSGRLALTAIGGFAWNSVEGEGCTVFTQAGGTVRGSLLPNHASVHVYTDVKDTKRDAENMEVRLDARTTNAEETQNLGIEVGDFVAFDPRVERTNGFVRSRHLDDKACAAVLVAALQALQTAGLQPAHTTCILFSNFEEVGHGGAAEIPASVEEFVAVDMAAIGEGQASDEYHATLCLKDSGGPYHAGLSQKLRGLAEAYGIPYKVDIYPNYGSDATAYWHAGGPAAAALIGPGVDSSHHYERTHHDALLATTQWVLAYLLAD
jgi:putative aminopeptidase FrvX